MTHTTPDNKTIEDRELHAKILGIDATELGLSPFPTPDEVSNMFEREDNEYRFFFTALTKMAKSSTLMQRTFLEGPQYTFNIGLHLNSDNMTKLGNALRPIGWYISDVKHGTGKHPTTNSPLVLSITLEPR